MPSSAGRWVGLLVLLLAGDLGAAELEFASGWGEDFGKAGVNASWVNLQFEVPTPAAVLGAAAAVPSLYSFSWTVPDVNSSRSLNKTAPRPTCHTTITRFDRATGGQGTPCLTMRADYKEAWAAAWAEIQPLVANGTYIGVFLGDENMWAGTSLANLTAVTDLIKADWPTGIVFINEAQDVANCGFNRLGAPIFADGECFPDTLDWFGYDYYCTIPGCAGDPYGADSGWEVARDGMKHMVYPHLARPGQRVVPTALGFFYKTNPWNESMAGLLTQGGGGGGVRF
jgi:hypothetical protein